MGYMRPLGGGKRWIQPTWIVKCVFYTISVSILLLPPHGQDERLRGFAETEKDQDALIREISEIDKLRQMQKIGELERPAGDEQGDSEFLTDTDIIDGSEKLAEKTQIRDEEKAKLEDGFFNLKEMEDFIEEGEELDPLKKGGIPPEDRTSLSEDNMLMYGFGADEDGYVRRISEEIETRRKKKKSNRKRVRYDLMGNPVEEGDEEKIFDDFPQKKPTRRSGYRPSNPNLSNVTIGWNASDEESIPSDVKSHLSDKEGLLKKLEEIGEKVGEHDSVSVAPTTDANENIDRPWPEWACAAIDHYRDKFLQNGTREIEFESQEIGIQFGPRQHSSKGGCQVFRVRQHTQAAQFGVQPGWLILEVNGNNARGATFHQVNRLLDHAQRQRTLTIKFDSTGGDHASDLSAEDPCPLAESPSPPRVFEQPPSDVPLGRYMVVSGAQVREGIAFHTPRLGKVKKGEFVSIVALSESGHRLRGRLGPGSSFEGGWVSIVCSDRSRWWLCPQDIGGVSETSVVPTDISRESPEIPVTKNDPQSRDSLAKSPGAALKSQGIPGEPREVSDESPKVPGESSKVPGESPKVSGDSPKVPRESRGRREAEISGDFVEIAVDGKEDGDLNISDRDENASDHEITLETETETETSKSRDSDNQPVVQDDIDEDPDAGKMVRYLTEMATSNTGLATREGRKAKSAIQRLYKGKSRIDEIKEIRALEKERDAIEKEDEDRRIKRLEKGLKDDSEADVLGGETLTEEEEGIDQEATRLARKELKFREKLKRYKGPKAVTISKLLDAMPEVKEKGLDDSPNIPFGPELSDLGDTDDSIGREARRMKEEGVDLSSASEDPEDFFERVREVRERPQKPMPRPQRKIHEGFSAGFYPFKIPSPERDPSPTKGIRAKNKKLKKMSREERRKEMKAKFKQQKYEMRKRADEGRKEMIASLPSRIHRLEHMAKENGGVSDRGKILMEAQRLQDKLRTAKHLVAEKRMMRELKSKKIKEAAESGRKFYPRESELREAVRVARRKTDIENKNKLLEHMQSKKRKSGKH
ncbi:hypothetical protein AAMO2058_000179900 [Amorphochlora amoebiformis]